MVGGGASVLERVSRARAKSNGLAGGLCRENMDAEGSEGSIGKGAAVGVAVDVLPLRRNGLWEGSEAMMAAAVAVGRGL